MTKINFLLTLSIQNQEKRLWELVKWSPYEKCIDILSNSLNLFFMEMYRDQFGEFVCGCWGLKGEINFLSGSPSHNNILVIFFNKTWKSWRNFFKFQSMSIFAIRRNGRQKTISLQWGFSLFHLNRCASHYASLIHTYIHTYILYWDSLQQVTMLTVTVVIKKKNNLFTII